MLFPSYEVYFADNVESVTGICISDADKQLSPIITGEDQFENELVEKSLLPTEVEKEIIYIGDADTLSFEQR